MYGCVGPYNHFRRKYLAHNTQKRDTVYCKFIEVKYRGILVTQIFQSFKNLQKKLILTFNKSYISYDSTPLLGLDLKIEQGCLHIMITGQICSYN